MKMICCLQILYAILICAHGAYTPETILNPNLSKENAKFCGRESVEKSSICDPKMVLSIESKNVIEGYLNSAVEYSQMGVLIIDQMEPKFVKRRTIDDAAAAFARQVHDNWGIGRADTNNGVVVFLSINDRIVYISTGNGVSTKLNDRILDDIIAHMRPYLKAQDYDKAIESAIVEITLILSGKQSITIPSNSRNSSLSTIDTIFEFINNYLFFIIFIAAIGYMIYNKYYMTRMERGNQIFEKFMKEIKLSQQHNNNNSNNSNSGNNNHGSSSTSNANGTTFDGNNDNPSPNTKNATPFLSSSCPICLEDYPSIYQKTSTTTTDTTTTTTMASNKTEDENSSSSSLSDTGIRAEENNIHVDEKEPLLSTPSYQQDNTISHTTTTTSTDKKTDDIIGDNSSSCAGSNSDNTTNIHVSHSTSNDKKVVKDDPRRPMSLQCGHCFCYTCLMAHFKQSKNNLVCPICRQSVDPSKPTTNNTHNRQSRPSHNNNNNNNYNTRFPYNSGSGSGGSGGGTSSGNNNDGRGSCAETFNTDDTTTSTAQQQNNTSQNTYHSSNNTYQNTRTFDHWLEWNYRINRMRYLYPNVMDAHTYRIMTSAVENRHINELIHASETRQVIVNRIITDYHTRQAASSNGRSGASFSFSGGRSSGGRGGRW